MEIWTGEIWIVEVLRSVNVVHYFSPLFQRRMMFWYKFHRAAFDNSEFLWKLLLLARGETRQFRPYFGLERRWT